MAEKQRYEALIKLRDRALSDEECFGIVKLTQMFSEIAAMHGIELDDAELSEDRTTVSFYSDNKEVIQDLTEVILPRIPGDAIITAPRPVQP